MFTRAFNNSANTVGFVILSLLTTIVIAYNEHPNFCIDSEPLLLSEIDQHYPHVEKNKQHCQVVAHTMTTKEKESFIETMCTDHGIKTHLEDDHQYFKLHNGEMNGRGSFHDICKGKTGPLLAWVPYDMIQKNYGPSLNPKEYFTYVAKATSVDRERTELCYFRHSDLVDNISKEFFTCTVMIFEDNYYRLDDNINVLVEIQPLMYELRNVTYTPWRNVTNSYKTMVGKSAIKNTGSEPKPIYGSLNYAYVEKIKINMSSIYEDGLLKLPLLLEHRFSVLELDSNGIGGVDVKEKAYFGRKMDPKSEVKIVVIGQWTEEHRSFSADIYEYFGYGISVYKQPLKTAELTIIGIENTEPVFEEVESTNLAKATIFKDVEQLERLSMATENSTDDWIDEDSPSNPYPGFYPWFVISCLILAVAVVFVIYSIVRVNTKKNKETKYELTGI